LIFEPSIVPFTDKSFLENFFTDKKNSFDIQIILEMLEIYKESLFQDKRIRELFPSSERAYNKEKKRKYENHLKKSDLIAYNELFLKCNSYKTFSKIYRLKSSTTASFGEYNYILMIPKTFHLIYFKYMHEPTINEYKTINLKYLNQKASLHIYNDEFYYYIETFLRLPNYSKNVKYWIKKQIDCYILKLLREGKLVKKSYSDKITQNMEKIVKNRSYRHYFLKGCSSVFALLNKSERENYLFGISRLIFKKTEICFHNVRLRINGNLMVILPRAINELMVNSFFNNNREVFDTFLDIGLNAIGINKRDVTSLEIVSLEVARELSQIDKTEHRDIPVLKYGKNTRKRDLGYIGFENFYDYIDFSSIDDYGEPIPEYEIQYFNRKNRTIDDFIRDIDILLPFDTKEPIIEIDIGINEIIPFNITASNPEITRFRNDFANIEKAIYEIRDLYGLLLRNKCITYNET